MNSLDGQVAVVTGGSRGIGREIARALAEAGSAVAVTGRNREKLDETVSIISEQGGQAAAFVMEVTDHDGVAQTMQQIEGQLGPIDLLVNNAGIGAGGTLWDVPVDDWWHVVDVNLRGVMLCSHAVMSGMIERRRGRVINVSSNAGIRPTPWATAYAVSKAAVLRLTDSTAAAAQEHGVSVFAISPGLVLTDMDRDVPFFKDIPPSEWTPIERAGELCVALASGRADKLTGRYIHANNDIEEFIANADDIVENDRLALRYRE